MGTQKYLLKDKQAAKRRVHWGPTAQVIGVKVRSREVLDGGLSGAHQGKKCLPFIKGKGQSLMKESSIKAFVPSQPLALTPSALQNLSVSA